MQTSDSIVIIPTYNERENIENIIRAVFGLPQVFHILVIEDGSPDGTAAIVRKLQQEFPEQLFMIERKENWDWVLPTLLDLNGHWNTHTSIFLKWMQTSVIIRMIYPVCIRLVRNKEEMYPSVPVMSAE